MCDDWAKTRARCDARATPVLRNTAGFKMSNETGFTISVHTVWLPFFVFSILSDAVEHVRRLGKHEGTVAR